MSETVNMYAEPNDDGTVTVFTARDNVDSEELTERVTDQAELGEYLDRHYTSGDLASGFVGTVTYTQESRIEDIRVSSRVHENPLA